jgi:hypothetical protein
MGGERRWREEVEGKKKKEKRKKKSLMWNATSSCGDLGVRALLAASLQWIYSLNFRENFKKVKKTIPQQLPYNYLHWEALFTSHSIIYSKNIISLLLYLFLFLLLIKVKITK